jgi:2-haloacid dehalogenase
MPPQTIKAIIFDLGGVLLEWNPRRVYRRYFDRPEDMESFLSEIDFPAWNAQQDKGRPFAEGVAALSAQYPHRAELIRAYHEHWEESVGGEITGTVQILRKLKRESWRLYALSNWSAETFPRMRGKYDFFALFDAMIVSGEVGLIKPDPAIFELAIRTTGAEAAQCLLIDDNAENVAAARRVGMQAIQFRSAEQLESELRELNVIRD